MQMLDEKYPSFYTQEDKDTFDKIRKIAQDAGAVCLVVPEQSHIVYIELEEDNVTSRMWDALYEINGQHLTLMATFITTNLCEEGARYHVRIET